MTRLIDADALMKDIDNLFNDLPLFKKWVREEIKKYIDNAPTVNPYFPLSEEVFNYITDAEFEHSDSFYIVTPSGKKIEFEKKRPRGELKCVTCKYHGCDITEKPCRECSRAYADLYEEAEKKGGAE